MIDRATVERIFDTADIVDVVSDFVQLKRAGTSYKGLSPFGNEKTPSFMVSPAKGIYKDFSSGKGGNVVGFLMEVEKLSYPEALRYLAKKYNIEIEEKEESAEEVQIRNERESMLITSSYAQKFFTSQLRNTQEGQAIGLSYLKERGFRDDIIDKFQIGYSPETRDAFTKDALKNGYKMEFMSKTGLTIDKGNYQFDRFAGRVIFPIHSLSGNVIGYGGRILKKNDKTAKYLNSPESEIYHKSKILYGLYHAKSAITKADLCYMVEGYTDVISMHQAGISNVVASSGTALTTEQIRLVKRFTNNITILYDGDPAGIKASLRGIDMILEEGMNVKVLLFPEGDDPDSFAKKHSATEVEDFINANKEDFIKFKTRLLLKDAENDPVKRAQLITDIVRSISVISEGITRSVYIKECSDLLSISEEVLYKEITNIRRKKFFPDEKPRPEPYKKKEPTRFDNKINDLPYEREIIRLLLQYGSKSYTYEEKDEESQFAKLIISEITKDELNFDDNRYRQIFIEYQNGISGEGFDYERHFIHHEKEEIRQLTADLLTTSYEISNIWNKGNAKVRIEDDLLDVVIPQTLINFKLRKIRQIQDDLRTRINVIRDADEFREAMTRIKDLDLIKMALTKKLGNITIIH